MKKVIRSLLTSNWNYSPFFLISMKGLINIKYFIQQDFVFVKICLFVPASYQTCLVLPKIFFVFSVLFDCLLELYWIHYSGFLSTVAVNVYFKRKTNLLLCNQLSFIFSLSMTGTGIILVWPVLPQHLTWNELMLSMDLKLAI